jgi:hypothetical protein
MNPIQQRHGESPAQWLARLQQIEASRLPAHTQRSLALSISYARYLVAKEAKLRLARQR